MLGEPNKTFLRELIEYGIKHPAGFSLQQILGSFAGRNDLLVFSSWLRRYMVVDRENILYGQLLLPLSKEDGKPIVHDDAARLYVLSASAESMWNDYLELNHARETAQKAQRQGNIATCIAVFALAASIVVGVLQVQAQLSDSHSWSQLFWLMFY